MTNRDVLTSTGRINYGKLQALAPDERLPIVRDWIETHKPADPGYGPAQRWLYRRERNRQTMERTRPQLERAHEVIKARQEARRRQVP